MDRFLLATRLGYPDEATETKLALSHGAQPSLSSLTAVCTPAGLAEAQAAVADVAGRSLCRRLRRRRRTCDRDDPAIRLGASPRATIGLLAAARAHAVIAGRRFVLPDDVKAVATTSCPPLGHRRRARRCLRCGNRGDAGNPRAGCIAEAMTRTAFAAAAFGWRAETTGAWLENPSRSSSRPSRARLRADRWHRVLVVRLGRRRPCQRFGMGANNGCGRGQLALVRPRRPGLQRTWTHRCLHERPPRTRSPGTPVELEVVGNRSMRCTPRSVGGSPVLLTRRIPGQPTVIPRRRGVVSKVTVRLASAAPFGSAVVVPRPGRRAHSPVARCPAGPRSQLSLDAILNSTEEGHRPPRPALSGDLRGVRPYQHGDGRRRVHWGASAHTGDLMVRESEERTNDPIRIVAELPRETSISRTGSPKRRWERSSLS